MKPGRELDRLIETTCFGGRRTYEPRPFSTELLFAWLLVEKLDALGFVISISTGTQYYSKLPYPVWVQIKPANQNFHEQVGGETPAHAICLAALRALEMKAVPADEPQFQFMKPKRKKRVRSSASA